MLVLGGTLDPAAQPSLFRSGTSIGGARTLELGSRHLACYGPGLAVGGGCPGRRPRGGASGRARRFSVESELNGTCSCGDESAAPAKLNMLEALPASATGVAYLGVAARGDLRLSRRSPTRWKVVCIAETSPRRFKHAARGRCCVGNASARPRARLHCRRGPGGSRSPARGTRPRPRPRPDLRQSLHGPRQSQRRSQRTRIRT